MQRRRSPYVPATPPYTHCKNCGYELHGQFCSVCGQHAFVANQPLRDSIVSYLETNYSFDHKLGHTLRHLLFRPGFLAREFMKGRVARHVHPFKLYFFSSILLFGVMIPINLSLDPKHTADRSKPVIASGDDYKKAGGIIVINPQDSAKVAEQKAKSGGAVAKKDSSDFERRVIRSLSNTTQEELLQRFIRYLSFSVLFLMPVFALLLMLVYRRKERYYLGHLILSIHQHVVLFLAISISLLWEMLISKSYTIGGWISLAMIVYLVLSLSRFYSERIAKSVMKAFILMFMYLIICSVVVVGVTFLVLVS